MKKLITLAMAALMVLGFVSCSGNDLDMVKIPEKNFKMLRTEVTQELYKSIMGENPSDFQVGSKEYEDSFNKPKGENLKKLPVEMVSWYDAVYFCNKLSERFGFTSVYSVNGNTNPDRWGYKPHEGNSIRGEITWNTKANGFRLPTLEEWLYAARGGKNYYYSGSNNLDEVGWYRENSNWKTHEVARKKPNGYGLYDMSGNVFEWCWDSYYDGYIDCRYFCGGGFNDYGSLCMVGNREYGFLFMQNINIGFRIVCSASN